MLLFWNITCLTLAHLWNWKTLHCVNLSWIELFLNIDNSRDLIFITTKRNHSKDSRYFAHSLGLAILFVFFDLKTKRKEERTTCEDECAGRTGRGSRTESCHLQGPSDGNCTVERRDAGVCVPTAYIYIYTQLDIYTTCNTTHTRANIFAQIYRIARCNRFSRKV